MTSEPSGELVRRRKATTIGTRGKDLAELGMDFLLHFILIQFLGSLLPGANAVDLRLEQFGRGSTGLHGIPNRGSGDPSGSPGGGSVRFVTSL